MGSRISGGRHSQKERQAGTNRSCRCSTPIMPGRTGKACRSGSPTVTDATTGYRVITALWRRPANLRPASALAACVLDRGPGRVDRVQPRLHRSPFWNGHRGRSAARPFLAARRLGARRATGHSPPHRSSERRQGSHYRRAGSYRGSATIASPAGGRGSSTVRVWSRQRAEGSPGCAAWLVFAIRPVLGPKRRGSGARRARRSARRISW